MKLLKTHKRLIDEGWRYKIEGDLISNKELDLTDLDKRLYVTGSIKAGGSIKASGSIEAGGSIKAGGDYGISAGLSITCKGELSFGLKAFAGICTWCEISDDEKTITCSKLTGGGVVEYGILREVGEPEQKKVTLELTDGQLEQIKEIVGE